MRLSNKKLNMQFIIGLFMIGVAFALALTSLVWTPYDPTTMSSADRFKAPSLLHIFGTDNFGRDIFSRVMGGMGSSIIISVTVIFISGLVGILIGSVCGYFGGLIDEAVMRLVDAVNSFPSILMALVIISLFGGGRNKIILALAICFSPSFIRIVRSEFIRLRDADYIVRAKLMGVSKFRILFRHILPNALPAFWTSVLIGLNNAILAESGLSYLGIGVQPPATTLGLMLSDAQGYLTKAPWYALSPGLVIIWIVLGFSLAGEGLKKAGKKS